MCCVNRAEPVHRTRCARAVAVGAETLGYLSRAAPPAALCRERLFVEGPFRAAANRRQPYFESGRRRGASLAAWMTGSGRDFQFAVDADSSHSPRRGLNGRSSRRRTQHLDPLQPVTVFSARDRSTLEVDFSRRCRESRGLRERSVAGDIIDRGQFPAERLHSHAAYPRCRP